MHTNIKFIFFLFLYGLISFDLQHFFYFKYLCDALVKILKLLVKKKT